MANSTNVILTKLKQDYDSNNLGQAMQKIINHKDKLKKLQNFNPKTMIIDIFLQNYKNDDPKFEPLIKLMKTYSVLNS